MENKKKSKFKFYIYAIIPLFSFVSVTFMATYAFYLATVVGNEDNGQVITKSAQVYAAFNATDTLNVEKILPGYSGTLEFSIVNTTKEENVYGNYTLAWEIVKNEIDNDSFTYTLTGTSYKGTEVLADSDSNKVVNIVTPRRIPTMSANIGEGIINTGVAHKYVLTVNFAESGTNQDQLQGKNFEGKIIAKGDPNI
jgi:hypothetical protein